MRCPICEKENVLSVCELTQNSRIYKIKPDGTRNKRPSSVQKELYMDEGYILVCENGCEVNDLAWEFINGKLVIYDEKYRFGRRL